MVEREYSTDESVIKDNLTQAIVDERGEQASSDLQLISNLLIDGYPFEVIVQYFETRLVVEAQEFIKERQSLGEGIKADMIARAQAIALSLEEEGRSEEYIDEMIFDLFNGKDYGLRYVKGKVEWNK